MTESTANFQQLVAEIAAAYFANSHVGPAEIGTVIHQIASSLAAVGETAVAAVADETAVVEETKRLTAAQVRKSITPEALISFEDGRGYKTLKRHLSTRGLTMDEYKAKWGLPKDYPSTAPSYSARRSALAKSLGLGQKGGRKKG